MLKTTVHPYNNSDNPLRDLPEAYFECARWRLRSDNRCASIKQNKQYDETAHKSSEYGAYKGFLRCIAIALKVLDHVHSK